MENPRLILSNKLLFTYFVSQGIRDNADLMRAQIFCLDVADLKIENKASVENIKNSIGYKTCQYDIGTDYLDSIIPEMIEF